MPRFEIQGTITRPGASPGSRVGTQLPTFILDVSSADAALAVARLVVDPFDDALGLSLTVIDEDHNPDSYKGLTLYRATPQSDPTIRIEV